MIPGLPAVLCRLCLWRRPPLIEIFGPFGLYNKLPDKMKEVFPFKVEENDGLPNYLCRHCIYQLELLHDFVLRSVIIDTTLRERYGLPNELLDSYVLEDEESAEEHPVPTSSAQERGNFKSSSRCTCRLVNDSPIPSCSKDYQSDSETVCDVALNTNECSEKSLIQKITIDVSSNENSSSPPSGNSKDPVCSESRARNVLPTRTNVVDKNKRKAIGGKKKRITCQKCSGVFRTRNEEMLHYCNSPSLSCIKCRYCGRQFNSLGALKKHKKIHTNIALFLCRNCGCTFQSWRDRRIHLLKECRGRSLLSTSRARDVREDNTLSANESRISSTSLNSDKHKILLRKSRSQTRSQMEVNGTSTPVSSDCSVKTKMNSATAGEKDTSEQRMMLKKSGMQKRSLKEVASTSTFSVSGASVNAGKDSATAEDKDTTEHTETDSSKSYSLGKRVRYRTYSDSIWLVG